MSTTNTQEVSELSFGITILYTYSRKERHETSTLWVLFAAAAVAY
jgi:hypothetical protein